MSLKNFLTAQKLPPTVAVEPASSPGPVAARTSWFERDDAPPPPVTAQAEELPPQPADDRTLTDNEIYLPVREVACTGLQQKAVDIVLAEGSPARMAGASLSSGDELTIPPRPIRPTVEVLRRLERPVHAASSSEGDWTPTPFNSPQRAAQADLAENPDRMPSPPLLQQAPLSGPAALVHALRTTSAPHKENLTGNQLIAGHQRLLPVPGGMFLWWADYLRETGDLVIRADSFDPLTVRHFFAVDSPPDLVTPDGLRLEAGTIGALAETFGNRRQAPGIPPPACVTRLTGPAAIKRPGQARADLILGDRVGIGELVETGEKTLVSLSFGQSLRIDLGNATRLRVDRWSHFSRTSGPILELTVLTGAFASIAAMSGMPPLVSMRTPCGTVSWCDASVAGQMALEGLPTMVALLRGALGVPGVLTVVNGWGTTTLSQSGHALLLRGHGAPGDPVPLTESLIDGAAFADLLPSRRREEAFRAIS